MTVSTKLLRIGIVLDDTLDRPDGVQQYVLLLGRWLAAQGHAVFYLVGHTKRQDIDNVHSMSRTVRVAFNANVLSIPLPANTRKAAQLLKELQLDVLHIQMPYSPMMAGRIIARQTNEALVGTFHILPYGRMAKAGSSLLGSVQRKSLGSFDAVMATSPAAAQYASTAYNLSASVVPNPVDVQMYKPVKPIKQTNGDQLRIVFLGRLVERKGALQLIKAFARMRGLGVHNARLHIGGKGPLLGKLQSYVNRHGLSAHVFFDGYVDEESKPGYLNAADIAVFPAMAGESFGIVLTEALAAGAGVVIGGNNPGYHSVLGEWPECLVQADNVEMFAHSLKTFAQDAKLRHQLHTEQQKSVVRYDIAVVGQQVLTCYRQAILHKSRQMQ